MLLKITKKIMIKKETLMSIKPQNNHIIKKSNERINNLGQLALLLVGGFIFYSGNYWLLVARKKDKEEK